MNVFRLPISLLPEGIKVDNVTFRMIVRRFTNRDGVMNFEDLLLSAARLVTVHGILLIPFVEILDNDHLRSQNFGSRGKLKGVGLIRGPGRSPRTPENFRKFAKVFSRKLQKCIILGDVSKI